MKVLHSMMHHILTSKNQLDIETMAENAIATATPGDRLRLEAIINASSLDEMHALAAEYLDQPELAKSIRLQRAQRMAKENRRYHEALDMLIGFAY